LQISLSVPEEVFERLAYVPLTATPATSVGHPEMCSEKDQSIVSGAASFKVRH
jgi:hypothetical protein